MCARPCEAGRACTSSLLRSGISANAHVRSGAENGFSVLEARLLMGPREDRCVNDDDDDDDDDDGSWI